MENGDCQERLETSWRQAERGCSIAPVDVQDLGDCMTLHQLQPQLHQRHSVYHCQSATPASALLRIDCTYNIPMEQELQQQRILPRKPLESSIYVGTLQYRQILGPSVI